MAVPLTGESGSSDVARHVARTAARLFAERGFDATSVREIVEAAGVTKPTLYYHFGSKDGLAHALMNVPLAGLVATLGQVASGPGGPVERLERLYDVHFDFCREEPDRARFYYAVCFGPHGRGWVAEMMKYLPGIDAAVRDAASHLAGAGLVPPGRVDDLVAAANGQITVAVMDFLYKGRDLGPDRARRLVADLLWGFADRGARP